MLTYYRNIDGVFLTQSTGTKNDYSGQDDDYSKQCWGGEYIEFEINDNGIVGFSYGNPINITETVVDYSSIKSYNKIHETFEKAITVTKASSETAQVTEACFVSTQLMVRLLISIPDIDKMKNEQNLVY